MRNPYDNAPDDYDPIPFLDESWYSWTTDSGYETEEDNPETLKWVVTCEHCKHWQTDNCIWGHDETPNNDDFCSAAERKEE